MSIKREESFEKLYLSGTSRVAAHSNNLGAP